MSFPAGEEDLFSDEPRTGLVVTDVQNDFASASGSLSVAGGEDLVPLINDCIQRARSGGFPVVYTQDWHPRSTPHFAKDGGLWPVHCVRGTWGAAFHPDLVVDGDVVRKGTEGEDGYSGFSVRDPVSGHEGITLLRSVLRARRVTRIVIAGIATDYCVKETALDGLRLGFEVVVPARLVRAVDLQPRDGERALDLVRAAGGAVV